MTAADPVPAITEADATGEIADLYADIRQTTQVPVVNLIWRHLATMPGALAWTWGAVRPLYASGRVARAAAAFREDMQVASLPAWAPTTLAAAGLDDDAQRQIGRVLASYDRSNAQNLVGLTALGALNNPAPATVAAREVEPGPPLDGELPRLIPFGELEPPVAALVTSLNAIGDPDQKVLASMYRHLAHWPPFLALVWTALAPLQADGRMQQIMDTNLAAGREVGRRLAGAVAPPAEPLPAAVQAQVDAALDLFIRFAIGRMVPIGRMVTAAFPAAR